MECSSPGPAPRGSRAGETGPRKGGAGRVALLDPIRAPLALEYPIDFGWFARAVLSGAKGRLEEDGTLLIGYGPLVGWRMNPTSQSILGLGLLQLWRRTGDEGLGALALKATEALVRQGRESEGGSLGFPIAVRPLGYRLRVPWYSALSQGMGASLFFRVGLLNGDRAWLLRARKALEFVAESPGLTSRFPKGKGVWFEEAPTDPPSHILNGHIYCTIAFGEVGASAGGEEFERLFRVGVEATAAGLPVFDADGMSYYDAMRRTIAKPYYQKLHIEQLRYLEALTGDQAFEEYARRWERRASEGWGVRTWLRYSGMTLLNGLRSEGPGYPFRALPYLFGENGFGRKRRGGVRE